VDPTNLFSVSDLIIGPLRKINLTVWGHETAELVEALCYKPEGSGFDSR
jgi:hypothetical protein